MTIFKMMEECDALNKVEVRTVDEEYADVVLDNSELETWQVKLIELLGEPLKKPGESAKYEAKALAKSFGGIQKEQSLYAKEFDNHCIISMLWPWQNNKYTTMKVFLITKDEYAKMLKPGIFSKLF